MIKIYLSRLPDVACPTDFKLSSRLREEEIKKIKNERVRREKYHVWRLLEYALSDALGFEAGELSFVKNQEGKWEEEHKRCYFSLSHSRGALCVAVSDVPVGVDVEEIRIPSSKPELFAERVLERSELESFLKLSDERERVELLISKWTQKEAFFKLFGGASTFSAREISTDRGFVITERATFGEKAFFVSVATENSCEPLFIRAELE